MTFLPVFLAAFEPPTTKDFVWPCITPSLNLGPLELCLNKVMIVLLLAMALTIGLFWLAFRKPKVVPSKFQALMEMGVDLVRNQIVLQMIGPEGLKYLPLLATLFFFILLGNILEVIPGINFPVNARVAFPLVMALIAWVVYNSVGVRRHGLFGYLKMVMFPPGAPKVLYLILTPIEFISVIIMRPITLTLRLTANMVAGHFLLAVFFLGTAALLGPSITAIFGIFSFALAVLLVGFEIFVAVLQAFIFSILTASYIAGAAASEH